MIYNITKNKKYNFVYKTTNNVNGKIYVGVHKTNNLDDGYLGSGVMIRRAIKKYGEENFTRVVLKFFDTFEAAVKYEEQLVDMNFVLREDTYNLRTGGYVNTSVCDETKIKISESQKRLWSNNEYRTKMDKVNADPALRAKRSINVKNYIKNNEESFKIKMDLLNHNKEKIEKTAAKHRGMKRSIETRKKQSIAKKLHIEKNGTTSFGLGKIYIHNTTTGERLRWDITNIIPDGWARGTGKNDKKKASGLIMYIKNEELNKEKTILKTAEIPPGWVKGRLRNG